MDLKNEPKPMCLSPVYNKVMRDAWRPAQSLIVA
ncbi:hypothetical protein HCH_03653 [Hahella chejuensis KCTC 2396]|uniref:Uncharacterized protein n=1 Tax=Hahella chejuensis (strain KCTC 2396) TaxID=349521 RepID=Q2SG31_HAHCH|nr:hypothetical protein HCH_03653 [Hahella chejuensis KCTC 2396]